MALLNLRCRVSDSKATLLSRLNVNTSTNIDTFELEKYIGNIADSAQDAYLIMAVGPVQASGTVTFSSLANNDTVTVNGVVFTAKTSGATGNVQFNLGANDTAAAANFVVKLNASTAPNKIVNTILATSAGAVTTITMIPGGQVGNLGTLAISAHGSVSGANLTGGTDGSVVTQNFGLVNA